MAEAHAELRLVRDDLHSLGRRLDLRGDQLSQLARRLRQASARPAFQAPAGDRSRVFVESQARRLDALAKRHADLHRQLGGLAGNLRPIPLTAELKIVDVGVELVDWTAAEAKVVDVIRRCPPSDRPEWEAVGADDDPELPTRLIRPMPIRFPPRTPPGLINSHGPAWSKPPLKPLGRTWLLDVTEIRQMTRQLRTLSAQIDQLGVACRRDLNDPEGRMQAKLRNAIERTGLTTQKVCDDIGRRLVRHAVAIDKKMATPGLLGPGPEYGLSAFGIKREDVPLDIATDAAFVALTEAGSEWHDRVLELTAIMDWLCRRLPVLFGTPAVAFLDLVGITDTSPPPERPPGALPPIRYPVPEGAAFTEDMVVDPATSVTMSRREYYQRYGVPFGSPLPEPLEPLPPDVDEPIVSPTTSGSSDPATDGPSTGAVIAAGAVVGAAIAAGSAAVTSATSRRTPVARDAGGLFDDDVADADADVASSRTTRVGNTDDVDFLDDRDVSPTERPAVTSSAIPGSAVPGAAADAARSAGSVPGAVESTGAGADPQVKVDCAAAVRKGGVRVTPGSGAALGSVVVGGAATGAVISKRAAAKKITTWARYKAKKHLGGGGGRRDGGGPSESD